MFVSMPPPDESKKISSPVFFYHGTSDINGIFRPHTHSWGQINCVYSGIGSFSSKDRRLIGLPGVGIWFPPHCVHECYNHHQMLFRVMNVAPDICERLPKEACMLGLTDIFQTVFADFFNRQSQYPVTPEESRLTRVLIDQLKITSTQDYFLPTTTDPILEPIIKHIEQNPADNLNVTHWAKELFTSERTINRKFQRCFGMSYREWRVRLRFLYAVTLLRQDITIEEIAFSLGYSSSSAFISMFQKFAHTTPQRYRENLDGPTQKQN